MESIFIEFSLIFVIAVGVSFVMRLFRLPLIVGYIFSGILISPYFLNLVKSTESVGTFANMGVAVLLFMVGLNLDPKVIKEVGKVSLITGIGQIIFTFTIGFFISRLLGFSFLASLYIPMALAFSSTIIIMKLLSDKGDTQTLYGKIAIGFLIVQDLVAILILMFISSFSGSESFSFSAVQKISLGVALLTGTFLFSILVLRRATNYIAKSQELLLMFSIGWAFALASLFSYVGFSIEIGALIAGISLSLSPYKYEIGSRMKPLRDFFILLFFILLGSQLTFENLASSTSPIIIFSLLVLIGNPFIVMILMGSLGYTKRNSFLAGLTVSQISEFSFILVGLGVYYKHVPPEVLSLMTIIGLVTMAISSYAISKGNKLYEKFSPALSLFERKSRKVDEGKFHQDREYDVIIFGYNRIGFSINKSFKKNKESFLVVDNNPETISKLTNIGVDCRYGDAEDLELLDDLPLRTAKIIISTIPNEDTNLLLLSTIKRINKNATFIFVSHQIDEALRLYDAGATYVLTPHFVGGDHMASLLSDLKFSKSEYAKEGEKHIKDLLARKKEGQRDVLHERG